MRVEELLVQIHGLQHLSGRSERPPSICLRDLCIGTLCLSWFFAPRVAFNKKD